MNEEVQFILDSAKESMDNAVKHLEKQLVNIRAGKASPAMLGSVMVNYYGSQTPLSQVSNINTPDGRTITVQPWERGMLQEIERANGNNRLNTLEADQVAKDMEEYSPARALITVWKAFNALSSPQPTLKECFDSGSTKGKPLASTPPLCVTMQLD